MVVGILIGSLLLVGGAWWAWKVKRRRNTALRAQPPHVASGQPYFYTDQKPHEADRNQSYELHGSVGKPMYELHESGGRPYMNCMSLLSSFAIKESGQIHTVALGVLWKSVYAVFQLWIPAMYLH